MAPFPTVWTPEERAVLDPLTTPAAIQAFLDSIPYSADPIYRSPRSVLRDRKAHCFDGAMFAAAALRRLGHPPLLVDLRAVRDDDHVLAIFRRHGRIGAVAKSNFAGLRYREPVFRTLRELALSYFEDYFNTESEKTLRSYSLAVDLAALDALGWETRDDDLERVAERLDRTRHVPLVTDAIVADLAMVDARSYASATVGTIQEGLYQPGGEKG